MRGWAAALLLCACEAGDSGDSSSGSGDTFGGAETAGSGVANESDHGADDDEVGTSGARLGSTGPDASSDDAGGETGDRVPCPTEPMFDIAFAEHTDIDPNLLSLDVRPAPGDGLAPAVVFVHGGGWMIGDKSGIETGAFALDFFADEGVTLVTTNYRLINDEGSPNATWSDQPADVSAALAWVSGHADELCIDRDRIILIGHSAGAHIAALVASDRAYLGAHDLDVSMLKSVVPLDVNAYDIPWAIENAAEHGLPSSSMSLQEVFTMDPEQHVAASPISHLDASIDHPPFLVVWAPVFQGVEQTLSEAASERFADALLAVGAEAEVLGSLEDDHSSLASQLGRRGHPPTEAIRALLQEG